MTVYSIRQEKKINPQRPLRGETASELGLSPAKHVLSKVEGTQRRKGKKWFPLLDGKMLPDVLLYKASIGAVQGQGARAKFLESP
jgi:hypothetical protein